MSILGGTVIGVLGVLCLIHGIAQFIVLIEDKAKKEIDKREEIYDFEAEGKKITQEAEESLVGEEGAKGDK